MMVLVRRSGWLGCGVLRCHGVGAACGQCRQQRESGYGPDESERHGWSFPGLRSPGGRRGRAFGMRNNPVSRAARP